MFNWSRHRLKIGVFLLLSIITRDSLQLAQADTADDFTVIAALTLNFARFTEWPAGTFKTNDPYIRLCVLGDNVVQQAFSAIDQRPVGTHKTLIVINLTRLKNIAECHLLYVSGLDRNTTIQLLTEISRQPVLAIAGNEQYFLEDGGMVALKVVAGKINMQINLNAVKQTGLQISSRVLNLATVVNP